MIPEPVRKFFLPTWNRGYIVRLVLVGRTMPGQQACVYNGASSSLPCNPGMHKCVLMPLRGSRILVCKSGRPLWVGRPAQCPYSTVGVFCGLVFYGRRMGRPAVKVYLIHLDVPSV